MSLLKDKDKEKILKSAGEIQLIMCRGTAIWLMADLAPENGSQKAVGWRIQSAGEYW